MYLKYWNFKLIIDIYLLLFTTKLFQPLGYNFPPLHCVKSIQIRSFSGPYFPVFELNTAIYFVNLGIQSEYREIRTRKNSVLGHFSRRVSIKFCIYIGKFHFTILSFQPDKIEAWHYFLRKSFLEEYGFRFSFNFSFVNTKPRPFLRIGETLSWPNTYVLFI